MWLLTIFRDKQSVLFLAGLILSAGAALLQNTGLVIFFGVKINLALVMALGVGIFLTDFWSYLFIALIAAAILRSAPLWDWPSTVFFLVLILSFYFKKYFFGKLLLNNTVSILIGTLFLYALSGWVFLIQNPLTVIQELIYNLIGGWILFLILEKVLNYETAAG